MKKDKYLIEKKIIFEIMLNPKQQRFCEEYAVDLNATDAAIRAGYSKKTAKVIACQNLTKLNIQQRIEELLLQKRIRAELSSDLIVSELKSLGFFSIKTFINSDNTIVNLHSLSTEQLRPVVGIKVKETTTTVGKTVTKEISTELKLSDKRAALVDLGRHIGIFEKDNRQKAMKIKVTRK